MLIPRQPAPELVLPTVDKGPWSLREQALERFTLLVLYRGLHCPVCRAYLSRLNRLHNAVVARGVSVVAVSGDTAERAEKAVADRGLSDLTKPTACLSTRRAAGGFTSPAAAAGRRSASANLRSFPSPASSWCALTERCTSATVQTMPFARPHFDELLKAIDFVIKNDYPARGEVR
jgi:hypothetical protein